MRSILLVVVALLIAVSLSACGVHNEASDGARVPSLSTDSAVETNTPEECPQGEILFGSECRKQRGIIIDQRPHVLGIIIDDNKRKPPPPPPPPPPSSDMDSPPER